MERVDEEKKVRAGQPPDGGWGWVIVIGGIYNLAMWGGIIRCYSVFFAPMISEFQVDYGTVSWLNGMFLISYGLSTCVCPSVMKKVERRKLSFIASIICGTSAFLASFCGELWQVQVLLGLVVGVTMGFISMTAFTVVARYFKKRLHTANQLLCLGISTGPLLLCPGYQLIITTYGWRGACQIVAGLFLNMAVASALMRPIQLDSDSESCYQDSTALKDGEDQARESAGDKPLFKPKNKDLSTLGAEIVGNQSIGLYTPTLPRKRMEGEGYNKNLLLSDSSIFLSKDSLNGSHFIEDFSPATLPGKHEPTTTQKGFYNYLRLICFKYDLVLMAEPLFYLYTFSWVGFSAANYSAFTYIIPYGETEMGLTKIQASTLVSGFAAGEIFSRIVYALAFDQMPQRFRIRYIAALFGAFATVVLLFPFVRGFIGAMACCILIGALGGGTDGIFATFIVELFPIQQYAAVFGYSNIITHSSGTAATVLIGVAVDRFGSLAVPFYIGCCTAAFSSMVALALHKVVTSRRRLKERTGEEEKAAV